MFGSTQIIAAMKARPGVEMEFSHLLGGALRSTYWGFYDEASGLFGLSTEWQYEAEWTEEEILDCFKGHFWELR